MIAVVFRCFFDDDRRCRHVDTHCERFSRKNDLQQTRSKGVLNDLFEGGHHSCMMWRNTRHELLHEPFDT